MSEVEIVAVRGWEVVRLCSDELAVEVVPGLGGVITSIRRRSDGVELLWRTPWGLRPPGDVVGAGDARTARWTSDPGGWISIFPNAGDATSVHGAEWAEDGEARLTPLDHQLTTDGSLIMSGRLVTAPVDLQKVITVRGDTVEVSETVRNHGGSELEAIWGTELRFGPPLLSGDTTVEVAANLVRPDPEVVSDVSYQDLTPWPRSQGQAGMINLHALVGPDAGERRLVYLDELDAGQFSVENRPLGIRVEVDWDLDCWPYLVYELEAGRSPGFPHFGRGYLLRLQPSSSWPVKGLYDARRLSSSTIFISPDQERRSHLMLRVRGLG